MRYTHKRIYKYKNNIKKKFLVLISCFIFSICSINAFGAQRMAKSVNPNFQLEKTATPTGKDGEYEISLKVKKGNVKISKPVDIVMILDTSGSMKHSLKSLKESVNSFIENISSEVGNVRISLVSFSTRAKILSEFINVNSLNGYTNGYDINESAVNKLENDVNSIRSSGLTNAQEAFQLAGKQFLKAREGSSKYELFFTDGLPNVGLVKSDDDDDEDEYNSNQYEYKKIGYKKGIEQAEQAYYDLVKPYVKNLPSDCIFDDSRYCSLKTYSIGLLSNIDNDDDDTAREFLKYVQNSGFYEADEDDSLTGIYGEIAQNIIMDNSLGNNVQVTDEVTKPFSIVKNAYGAGITSKVTLGGKEIQINNNMQSISGNNISWNLGNLNNGELIIKFKIKTVDPYYGGKNIDTNVNATFDCIDPITKQKVSLVFNKPKVNIPYTKGSIKIIKEVNGDNSNTIQSNDKFKVNITGFNNSKYSVSLNKNKQEILEFYLKGKDTDISDNTDVSIPYLEAGKYNVKELIPMNYKLEGIYINGKEVNSGDFVLDNNNNNITIKIVNKYSNNGYFYDKSEKNNKFILK